MDIAVFTIPSTLHLYGMIMTMILYLHTEVRHPLLKILLKHQKDYLLLRLLVGIVER